MKNTLKNKTKTKPFFSSRHIHIHTPSTGIWNLKAVSESESPPHINPDSAARVFEAVRKRWSALAIPRDLTHCTSSYSCRGVLSPSIFLQVLYIYIYITRKLHNKLQIIFNKFFRALFYRYHDATDNRLPSLCCSVCSADTVSIQYSLYNSYTLSFVGRTQAAGSNAASRQSFFYVFVLKG